MSRPELGVVAETFDCVVVGGGPSGSTAARHLASQGRTVLLLDRQGRIKPCGGAIPPRLIKDFDIPDSLICAKASEARMIAPSDKRVRMPIEGGYVGMVNRESFDEWLRNRAEAAGAQRRSGTFTAIEREADGSALVLYRTQGADKDAPPIAVRARTVIGADGARSNVAAQQVKGADRQRYVFAYHEIIKAPAAGAADFEAQRCDVWYQGNLSPDFYAWIFPHGETASIGVGSMQKGFSLRTAVTALRKVAGLEGCETVRTEGAPIPLKPMKRWDNGRDVVLAGDAAGVVAPASGEGIYYAMEGGRLAAEAVEATLATGDVRELKTARKRFMKAHGKVFMVLGIMQHFWYRSDKRRERFVALCDDPDIQELTWQAYMNKELVKAKPAAHARIFFKDMGHLLGLRPA
ncbi:geranylgeranyl diphosphate reductase [Brevundimonas aurifodinae]|uniref:geranylgeranyl diphosphate reductase n=2 Tax=Brevundimonas TaxID=41275 RepID=A0ABV1NPE9_9CAUL|nr:MAG: geranylgeranyl diphosphate reductase [Brevundimonas sp. 12-68-7]OYX36014.1 MAG: geranylgeranyl diphosphate reductase [Brevundimonas subvibrioides]